MDPLSVSASITAVLQLTTSVISYLNDVKSASDTRQRLRTELTGVGLLLDSGIDAKLDRGYYDTLWHHSALSIAMGAQNLEIAQALLERGADANSGDRKTDIPLQVALLYTQEPFRTQICRLLRHGANPTGRSDGKGLRFKGNPLLQLAVRDETNDIVEMLLQNGADINAPGPYGDTALHFIATEGLMSMLLLRPKYGAEADTSKLDPAVARLPDNERQ